MGRKIDDICQNWKNSEIAMRLLSKCNDYKIYCFMDFLYVIGIVLAAVDYD